MAFAHAQHEVEAEREAHALALQKYRAQTDKWKEGAESIRRERATDATSKMARLRIWENKLSKWLQDGENNKLDAIVYAENKKFYEQLASLLREEYQCLAVSQAAWDATVTSQMQQAPAAWRAVPRLGRPPAPVQRPNS